MLLRLLLASAVLLAGCSTPDSSDDQEPEPESPATWTVELGTAPTLLTLTGEDVYAASYGTGVGGSQVYRVDRATGRKAAQRTLAGQPNGLALGPSGELWLATVQLPDQPSGTGLQVLDPVTLQTRRALPVEGIPLSVAFVGEDLWTGDEKGVRQLDPATGEVRRQVTTQVPAYRLLVLGRVLLVVGPQGLQRVEPRTGAVSPPRPLPDAAGSIAATGDEERLWVVHPDAQDRAVLRRLDPLSLEPVASAPSPGRAGAAADLADDVLWVTDPAGGRLLCADPLSGQVRGELSLAVTGPLAADGRSVVVAQSGGLAGRPADCGAAD